MQPGFPLGSVPLWLDIEPDKIIFSRSGHYTPMILGYGQTGSADTGCIRMLAKEINSPQAVFAEFGHGNDIYDPAD